MGTINSAFYLIAKALDADQAALNVVANNVANASTPGYTREVPQWQESQPTTVNGVTYGTGASVTSAMSVRDSVLNARMDQQQELASSSAARLTALDALQALFTPASGASGSTAGDIGSDITSFFQSFAGLEANPTNSAPRQAVLSAAKTLAGDISNAAASLNEQKTGLDQEASGVTAQVNALTTSIAQLNQQIQSTSPNGDAGTLEDQRQQDLSQLSQLIGINQITTENNGISVTTTSGQVLVSEGSSVAMTNGTVDGVTHFFVGSVDATAQLTTGGGELGGILTARDQDIPSALASLDQLAYGVSIEANAQNNAGVDMNGNAGGNIFSTPTQVAGSAAAMSVVMTDPNAIAAAGAGQGTGDDSNAIAMSNLATLTDPPILNGLTLPDGTTLASGQTLLGDQTPINYYSSFVSALGSTVSEVQTENTAQSASVTQLQNQISSNSAVNLNDEAGFMQQFERSYQAASQVFTILNTVMASALNLGDQTAVS